MRRRFLIAALAVFAVAARATPGAHEIPRDVTVHAFVKPEGQRLHVRLRAPLSAMRDIQFPRRGNGDLDVARAEPLLRDAVVMWLLPGLEIREEAAVIGPPAIAAISVSPNDDLEVALEYPIQSDRSRFAIRPGFERLGVHVLTALRFETAGGAIRAFELHGDPGLVRLDPRWHQAAARFVKLGIVHILDGIDHLLFLLCLVIPFRRLRPLIIVATAFTAAHSIALIAAALGLVPDALWFPPLVETLIAASILYVAIENIVAASNGAGSSAALGRRALLAFAFGLVHGFGFSFALKETLQFAGAHLLTSLVSFNLGVEIGQVIVLLVLVPALALLFRYGIGERIGTIVMSALIGHVAWHWMADRWNALRQYAWPAAYSPSLLTGVRLALAVTGVALIAWWVRGYVTHSFPHDRKHRAGGERVQ